MTLHSTCLLCTALFCATLLAEPRPAPKPPASTPVPAKTYAPTDLEALRPLLGQSVTVEGAIARAGESKTKTVRYLNFTSDFTKGVTLVFFVSAAPEAFQLEALKQWVGKKVRVTGTLSDYNNGLQIKIEKMDQLKEIP